MTAFDRNYKPDTIGLFVNSGGGAADLVVNKAFHWPGLTNNTTYCSTTGVPKLGVTTPKEISVVASLSNAQSGILVNFGNTGGGGYAYRVDLSAGSVTFRHNSGTTLATVALPGVTGTPSAYVVHWSTDYSVVENSYFSEFAVCRLASGAWTITRVTHAVPAAPGMGWQFNISGYGAGNSLFSGGLSNITAVRIGERFHSSTEAREDWQTESSAPSPTGYLSAVELAPVCPVYYTADVTGDYLGENCLEQDSFAGPAEWLASLHAATGRTRLFSPLVNLEINSPPTLQDTWLPANFWAAGSGGYQYGIQYLFACPVPLPPGAGGVYGRVRVHAQNWLAAGAPMGATASLGMIMRTSTEPAAGDANYTDAITTTVNHGSGGMGQWYDLGELPLLMDAGRMTFLALGLSFGLAAQSGFRRAKIKALHVDCYFKDGGG